MVILPVVADATGSIFGTVWTKKFRVPGEKQYRNARKNVDNMSVLILMLFFFFFCGSFFAPRQNAKTKTALIMDGKKHAKHCAGPLRDEVMLLCSKVSNLKY